MTTTAKGFTTLYEDSVRGRWDWSDNYLNEVQQLLKLNAGHMMSISIASFDADAKRATDIELVGADVAVRVRNGCLGYRDFTVRSSAPYNQPSEWEKIQLGCTDFYLYGWTNHDGHLDEWMLVDCDKLRESGLLENAPERRNRDGSTFRYISLESLQRYGCIVNHDLKGLQQ
jgi:hypothetical protein